MKSFVVGFISGAVLLLSYPVFSGRSTLDLMIQQQQQERQRDAAAEKLRAAEIGAGQASTLAPEEIAQWKVCWLKHGRLMGEWLSLDKRQRCGEYSPRVFPAFPL